MFSKEIVPVYKIYTDYPGDGLVSEMAGIQRIELINSPWSEDKFEKYFEKKEKFPICVLCLNKKNLCGFVLGRFSDKNNVYILSTLVVDESMRGNGMGRKLTQIFIDRVFEKANAEKIVVNFRDSNRSVEIFYKKIGFENCRITSVYKNGEPKYEMELVRSDIVE